MYTSENMLTCLCTAVIMLPILVKIWYNVTKGRFNSKIKMTGKTVLITGSNRGIGLTIAMDMARRGARVILACRDQVKAEVARLEIIKATGIGQSEIKVIKLDLSDFESVRKCAENVLKTEKRLDYLVNNAGVVLDKNGYLNGQGIEMHFATNHFGHYLLTILLLPLMIRTGNRGRIVNLASYFHFIGRIDLNDIFGRPSNMKSTTYWMYGNTKLANVLFTRQLAEYLKDTGITVNAVNPGNTESDIAVKIPRHILMFGFLIRWFCLKTPEEGSQPVIHALLSPDLDGITGQYMSDCGIAVSSPASKNRETMKWLWDFSKRVTNSPDIKEVMKIVKDTKDINFNSSLIKDSGLIKSD